jgi:hypothetical protein
VHDCHECSDVTEPAQEIAETDVAVDDAAPSRAWSKLVQRIKRLRADSSKMEDTTTALTTDSGERVIIILKIQGQHGCYFPTRISMNWMS